MKKYLSKQLMMLAILLLSGIGGAFAQRTITTNYGIPDVQAQTGFATIPDGSVFVYLDASKSVTNAYNGEEYTFKDDIAVSLRIEIGNPVYQLESIKVNDTDVTDDYIDKKNNNKDYVLPDGDLKIDIEFSLIEADKISEITANFDGNYGNVSFLTQLGGWIPASSGTPIKMAKGHDYSMRVYPYNPLCGSVKSVTDNDATINCDENGAYSFNNLSENHTVNVTFEERSSTKNNITVIYNQDYADAGINILNGDETSEGVGVWNNEPCEAAAGEGFNYRVSIYLKNPQDYVISEIQVGGTGVEFSKTPNGGYFDIIALTKDTTVTVTIAEREKNTITVSWVDGCNSIEVYDQYNGYIGPQAYSSDDKEGVWVLPTGSPYRLIIGLSDSEDYFATVKIGDGDPVNATYNDYYNRYEFDIEALSSDLNIAVSAVAMPTNEIAVTCTYLDALNIEIVDQENGNWFGLNEDGKANLRSDKTYRMYINNRVPDVYSFTSIMLDETDYTEYFTDEDGDNNYIEFANPAADHTVAITLDKKPSNTITVNRNGDLVWANLEKVVDNWNRYGIGSKSETESIVEWEVLSNQTYRVSIGVHNPLIYEITSVIIDKDTDGEANITEIFTDNNNDNNYIEFADISANHTVDVVAAKQGETKQFTLKAFFDNGNGEERIWYGEYSDIELYDQAKEKMIGAGESFELLEGSTTRLMITPHLGYKVKTIMVDEVDDVTETFNACDGYYEFADLDDDHSIKVVFEEASTHYIKVTRDEEVGWFALQAPSVYYDNVFNEELDFNEGTNVIMRVDSLFSKWDEESKYWVMYKLTKIMDGETDITPSTTNDNSQYEVSFNNLSADHNVSLTYEPIPFYNVIVNFDGIEARLEPINSDYWISSGKPYKYEEGESVKLILGGFGTGLKLSVTVNDNPVNYTAGGIILTENISGDIVVNVTTEEVQAYYVGAGFTQYSQGTVYMESDLYGKCETNWDEFNAGSNVTVTIVPSIGYELSELVLINRKTNVETTVNAVYNEVNKEYTYVIENLDASYELIITTAKKSMAGIDPQPYSLGENGMGTYCSEYDLDFSSVNGITAYIASGFDPVEGYVVLTKVFKVPAGTGIIIKGTPGNYEVPVAATNFYYRNMLVGVVKATPVPQTDRKDVEYANYILLKKDGDTEPTFYRSDGSGDMPANRAYLQIPLNLVPSANNTRITTVFEDEVTPVEDILTTSDSSKDDYYNLNGQKVQTVKKGIYIKNGKKVIIR